jgi:signal transduction histidine kinase/CheY-like chemotaxis protein
MASALGPHHVEQNLPHIEGALAGFAQEFERTIQRPDGAIGYVLVNYIPDIGSNGSPQGFFAFETDITGLKEANESLERRVTERTRELAVQAQLARKANLAKSEFLANMSHEIRTPLSSISGMAKLIAMEPLSAAQRERMGKLETAVTHLKLTINDILDLAKIEANKLVLDLAPVDLHALAANVAGMAQSAGLSKGLELKVSVEAVPQCLLGDPTRMAQALLNYLGNAFKFTQAGSITLRVSLQQDFADAACVRFEVQDTGIGIAADKLATLFEPFVQADATTTRRYGGTGLGLALTKRLVEAMGGEVGARSTLGRGSLFWFTVRMAKMVAPPDPPPDAVETDALAKLRRHYAGHAVLLADDDVFNREIGTILLQDCGLEVDVAQDGLEAARMAIQKRYALILMDMQMPGADGVEATQRIRAGHVHNTVPIVAMTANAFAEDRARCLEAGMNDFLTKPVDPLTLYQTILRQFMQTGV